MPESGSSYCHGPSSDSMYPAACIYAAKVTHKILGGKKSGNMVEDAVNPGQKKTFVNILPPPGW
eukprot:2276186-Prymnesium_polylepis.1